MFTEQEYKLEETRAYLELGIAHTLDNHIQMAIEQYKKALKIAMEEGYKLEETSVLLYLGVAYRLGNNILVAIQLYEKAFKLARERGYQLGEIGACLMLGEANIIIKCNQSAFQFNKLTLEIEVDDKLGTTTAPTRMGEDFGLNDLIRLKSEYFSTFWRIAKQGGCERQETDTFLELGNAYILKNQMQVAFCYYNKALEIATELDDKKGETRAYLALGEACSLKSEFSRAILHHEKALKIAREQGYGKAKTEAYFGLGDAYRFSNQNQTAIQQYQTALEIAREHGYKLEEISAYLELGISYRLDKQLSTAIACHEKALQVARRQGYKQEESKAYLELGICYRLDNQVGIAIDYERNALKIAREQGYKLEEIDAYLELGIAHRAKKHLHAAVLFYKKALLIAREEEYKVGERNAYMGLEEAHKFNNEVQMTAEHSKKATEMVEEKYEEIITDQKKEKHKGPTADQKSEESSVNANLVQNIVSIPETKQKHEEINKMDSWFKNTFLDSRRKLKDEIHEELKSFPWFCGAYGLAPPNKKIPRLHLFLTVKRGTKKSDARRDLEEKYHRDPKKYFELLQEPKKPPKVRYLGNGSNEGSSQEMASSLVQKVLPSPGGGVLACVSGNPNQSQGPDEGDRDDSHEVQGTGTLTLFCFSKGHHYALTCFHVGCANDEMRYNATFNKVEDIQKIRNSLSTYVLEARRKRYLFTGDLQENNNEPISYGNDGSNCIPLGDFHSYRFDSECDILCLKTSNNAKINCKIAEVGSLDWESIWDELIEKFSKTTVEVGKLQLSPLSGNGHIVSCCISYGKEKALFKNAVVVKGCTGPFLENGDSGSLVFFHANNKKPIAYGVCEVDELHLPQHDLTQHTTGSIDDGSDTSSNWSEEEYSNESISESEDKLEAVEEGAEGEYKDIQTLESKDQIKCQKDNEFQNYAKCSKKDFNDPDDSESMFQRDTGPYFICLRLDTALERLGLDEAVCVDNCGRLVNS